MLLPLATPEKPDTITPTDDYWVRGQSLVMARWVAIFGQAIAILVAFYGFGFSFPIIPCMGLVILLGLINNYAVIKDHHRTMPISRAFAYLAFDLCQLTALLALTGGITNPFSVLLLAPVLVGASVLTRHYMIVLLILGIGCAMIVTMYSEPMIWPVSIETFDPRHHIVEIAAFAITIIFTGFYAWRMAEESRSILKAGHAAKTALLKQKQLQALGAQAAAAVHELGSPLGTITIIAKELSLELGKDHPHHEDIAILLQQTKRCQDILRDFGATIRHDTGYTATPLPVHDLIHAIAKGFLLERPDIRFMVDTSPHAPPPPTLPQSAEIMHGVGVYIQNAIQFATSKVSVLIHISDDKGLIITIQDDGPGFSPTILSRLGEPYTSTRMDSGKNMGLGVFIAQTLLEETGAIIEYNNTSHGGAQVKLQWTEQALRTMFLSHQ